MTINVILIDLCYPQIDQCVTTQLTYQKCHSTYHSLKFQTLGRAIKRNAVGFLQIGASSA